MKHLKVLGELFNSSTLCVHCSNKVFDRGGVARAKSSFFTSSFRLCRSFSTTPLRLKKKKDYYAEEKLPIFDYGKIHSEKKRLYVFGGAAHGALGLQTLLRPEKDHHKKMLYMQRPVRHTFGDLHTVTNMAAGHGFSLVSVKPKKDNDPVVFGCGYNKMSQLGYQPGTRDFSLGALIAFVPIPLPLNKTTKVIALGAGRGHSLISVEGMGLLTLGENSYGQCGRSIIDDEEYQGSKYVCRIPSFGPSQDYDVVQIASRFDVSVCLTRMGTVYTFGCNNQGQLGRGKDISRPWEPAQLEGT
ncbi:Williams-Beuren syndrome chromosomal region 16 protein [Orchesella cincta]|uniref:Williams-Beuren syndrome chromosomal region 16 protein n=1 Tax=Orchesella cincta TaxID=48709 RepID=A0A1D2NKB0_ORCCI|nr:Williams-Beuren syndrome chromosomal region 16 protein [Orchesella cincta]